MNSPQPSTDEREALLGVIRATPKNPILRYAIPQDLADAILAAGFHRTPAPSDEDTRAAITQAVMETPWLSCAAGDAQEIADRAIAAMGGRDG